MKNKVAINSKRIVGKGIMHYLFIVVIMVTPNLPMPRSAYGPVGPALYLFITFFYLFLNRGIIQRNYRNPYFKYSLILTVLLLLSDLLKVVLFDPIVELRFFGVRLVNLGIFFMYGQFFVQKELDEEGNYTINKTYFKYYLLSILVISLILYGQALGVLNIGVFFRARTYFGIQLPFYKPLGLVDLSDGKLGMMIAPIIFLGLLVASKKYAFIKIKYGLLIAGLALILLIILQSRSGYLGFALSLVLYVILYPSRKLRLYSLGIGLFVLAFLLATGLWKFLLAGIVGEGTYEKNVYARGSVYAFSVAKFYESPLYGVGHIDLIKHKSIFSSHGVGNHNLFLDHLGSGGLIAFIPFILTFILFYYYCIKDYFIALKNKAYKRIGLNIWIMIATFYSLIEQFFYRGFYNEYLYLFLALGIIPALNISKHRRKQATG